MGARRSKGVAARNRVVTMESDHPGWTASELRSNWVAINSNVLILVVSPRLADKATALEASKKEPWFSGQAFTDRQLNDALEEGCLSEV